MDKCQLPEERRPECSLADLFMQREDTQRGAEPPVSRTYKLASSLWWRTGGRHGGGHGGRHGVGYA